MSLSVRLARQAGDFRLDVAFEAPTPGVTALFGPSGEHEWGPWMVHSRVAVSRVHPCRPCGIDGCGGGKVSECLTTLRVDDVYAQFVELLAESASATESMHLAQSAPAAESIHLARSAPAADSLLPGQSRPAERGTRPKR